MSEGKANKWLQENQDKKILDIQMSAGGFGIIYEEQLLKVVLSVNESC